MFFLFIRGASATSLSDKLTGDFRFVGLLMLLQSSSVLKRQQTALPSIYCVESKTLSHITGGV